MGIVLCLHNARAGRYGKSYHRLSEEDIFGWLTQYQTELSGYFENEHQNRKTLLTIGDSARSSPTDFDGVARGLAAVREMAEGVRTKKADENYFTENPITE